MVGRILGVGVLAVAIGLVVLAPRVSGAADGPTAGVDPAGSAVGGPGSWSVPFGERPRSGPVTCDGRSNVVITGKTFADIGGDTSAIRIRNCHNVTVTGNDFLNDAQPITVEDSTGVEISWNRYRNITGPHARDGANRANFTQWINSRGGSIRHNKGIGGDTEDIISIFNSGGTDAARPLVIENNAFQGTDWSSDSGSGVMLGDAGGSHIVVRNNTLISPGAVGIGVAGGTDITVTGNTVLGVRRAASNVGIYVWNQSSGACSDIEVSGNRVSWVKEDGTRNALWDGGNCGPVAGWSSNRASAPSSLTVDLGGG